MFRRGLSVCIGIMACMMIWVTGAHSQEPGDQIFLPLINGGGPTATFTPTATATATDTATATPTPTSTNTPTPTNTPTSTFTPTPTPRNCPLPGVWAGERGRKIVFSISEIGACQVETLTLRTTLACSNGGSVSQRITFLSPKAIFNNHFSYEGSATVSGDFAANGLVSGSWSSSYRDPISGNTCSGSGSWQASHVDFSANTQLIDTTFLAATALITADLDRDGDLDLLGSGETSGVIWWENQGTLTFAKHVVSQNEQFYDGASVQAVDLDGDQDIDIVSGANFRGPAWWENDGSETFTKHALVNSTFFAKSAVVVDLDGDSDMDIVVGDSLHDRISWFENDGSQNFMLHELTARLPEPQSVQVVDLDGDGDLDFAAALSNLIEGKLAWWENDGAQAFTEHVLTTDYAGAKSIFAVDLNQDGHIDLLSTATNKNDLSWWQNDGAGNFAAHTLDNSLLGAQGVYAADADGDLDIDIVAAAYEGDMIALWENDGNAAFTKRIVADGFYGVQAAHIADIDGDGMPDILGASAILNTVAAWLGNPANHVSIQRAGNRTNVDMTPTTILETCHPDSGKKVRYHNGILTNSLETGC
ncbi:MAG: VCBS repeat-containing protein [Caldilineaceae bacterium]|nr:VCBS repeat-containing protein [Caldilineaceae bacterium]